MTDADEIPLNVGWALIAVGLAFILDALPDARRGWTTQAVHHRWGYYENVAVDREVSPIQFWFLISFQFLLGLVILFFGVRKLLAP